MKRFLKKKHIKVIKLVCKTIGIGLTILCVPIVMFCFDIGRQILLNGLNKYFQSQGIIFEIKGLNRGFSKVDGIFVKLQNGMEISISNISIKRDGFLSRADIYAEKFSLKSRINEKSSSDQKSLKEISDSAIYYAKTLRTFVKTISIDDSIFDIEQKKYKVANIKYDAIQSKDNFRYGLDENYIINLSVEWNTFSCSKIIVQIKKLKEFSGKKEFDGKIEIKDPNSNISPIKFEIEKNGKVYKTDGNLHLQDDAVFLNTKINLDDCSLELPNEIKSNFENLKAVFDIKYFIGKNNEISIKFERDNQVIGDAICSIQNNIINISGNINWISICDYRFKKFHCRIFDLQKINTEIYGEDFKLNLSAKIDKNIFIENAIFAVQKNGLNGFIKTMKPFTLANANTNVDLEFKFDQLDFWNKIIPISGDSCGTISYKNAKIKANCKGKNIVIKDSNLLNYTLSIDDKNISLKAANASYLNSKWQNVFFDISKGKLNFSGKSHNQSSTFMISGTISDSLKNISLNKGKIKTDNLQSNIKICDLDFDNGNYKIICDTADKRSGKTGSLHFHSNKKETNIKFNSFQPNIINVLLGVWFPRCRLNGAINLEHSKNSVSGNSHIIISDLLSGRSSVELNGRLIHDGLQLNAIVKNAKNVLRADMSVPISLQKNGTVIKSINSMPIKCHIFGATRLEHLFELPDQTDARGLFDCNLYISGSFSAPQINGNANLKNGYFVMGDVFLKNGDIQFKCYGDTIAVSHAEFVDSRKKKMIVTGNGKFFFDGLIPNIKTNLVLSCNDFTLFDSEDLNIAVSGKGRITGNIDDLLISGDVDITKCKVQNMDAVSSDQNDGIVVDNEINVISKKQIEEKKSEKDFCRYDIIMRCPKVLVVGSVFDMILGGNLRLASYEHRATLSGLLKLQEGKLNLFGKRLLMRKGEVEFFEQYPFDPRVSLVCTNNFGEMVVYLKIKNAPEKGVSFNLYSVPSYSQEVILSQMLFGKDMKYLSVSEAAQFAQAMSSFKQKGYIFSILNTFKSSGIIDSISFSNSNSRNNSLNTNTQTSETQGNMNVSAGKYIGDNLFISVNKNSDESTSFDIDYSLTPKISVKANTNGEAGISWKYKY